jgi:hypothetical protein
MKKRRINPLEAHFEKIVLVVVSAVLLGVVAMQFLTQPNAVQISGSPTPVPPDRVFDRIAQDAEAVLARMRDTSPSLPEVPEQDVASRFAEVSDMSLADSVRLSAIGESVRLDARDIGPSGSDAATVYAMPQLPRPASLAVGTHRATVDPFFASQDEVLRALLPAEQPLDKVAVSVEGVVNGAALRRSLEQEAGQDDDAARPLPLSWWRGNLELLGVEVEREERTPTGSWGGARVISGLPGVETSLARARQASITPAELVQVAQGARLAAREIAQPAFPPTVAGPEWTRPSEMSDEAGMSDADREIARLKRQYDALQRRADGLRLQLERIGAGGGGGEGGIEDRGRRRETGDPGRTPVDRDQQQRERIQAQIEAVEGQMFRIAGELADRGAPIDEQPGQQQTNEPPPPLPSLLEAEALPVWVHDLTAEPGKTYRYRMRVVVNNPLYAKDQYLSEAQRDAAASPTLAGGWSDWSTPVEVEADRHFFVVSASESDVIGSGPRAAVEVYQFYYGYWRKGSATLTPGDTISARVSLPDNLLIWDEEKLAELGTRPGMPARPGVQPGLRPEGFPEDRRRREFEGEIPSQRDDPRRTGTPGQQRTAPGEEALPEGATKAPSSLDLYLNAMLLDVTGVPGADGTHRVIFRSPEGGLLVRTTGEDRSNALYRRLAANAREGEAQNRPEPDPNQPRNVPVVPRNPDRAPPGGGGGGGG